MEFTALQIAEIVGGKVEGDVVAVANTFASIEKAGRGSLTFVAKQEFAHYLSETKASIVLISEDIAYEGPLNATLVRTKDAYIAIALLLKVYEDRKEKLCGIEQPSYISPSAVLGKDVYVGAFAYIGKDVKVNDNTLIYPNTVICDGVEIGSHTIIYPNSTIYQNCHIGNNVIIHAGAVIGADGFGFIPNDTDTYEKIPQIGGVIIEDNVEIGANTCIDRSTMGWTIVHKGVKIDNLVQVGHNVEIGENTVMSAQVGIAGSTKVGSQCVFGGQVGIAGHITIGDKTKLGAQSGVPGSIKKEGQSLLGSPPINPRDFFKSQILIRRLPEMYKQLNELQKEIEKLRINVSPVK